VSDSRPAPAAPPPAELRPWQVDVGRLRRAQAVHSVVLQVILVLLVLLAGAIAGLATATVATHDVVKALSDPGATAGPLPWDQYRVLRSVTAYYVSGPSTYHACVLGLIGAVFLVLAFAVRRRLLPDGVSRRRLVLAFASVAAVYVFFLIVADPFDEISRRVALDRFLLLPASTVWNNAVEVSFLMQVPLALATLALALAALTPTRIALPCLGAVAGIGYALVLLCKLPFGPLSRPPEPPESFLDLPTRAVRVLDLGERPRIVRGVLSDVGLVAVPPPLGADAEKAAGDAFVRWGLLDDLRGTVAARLWALAPLARFAVDEYAFRVNMLYLRTSDPELLRRLAAVLRGPLPRDPAADTALAALSDPATIRFGDAAVTVCRALVGRGQLELAAKVKDAARAEGADEKSLAPCEVAPPGPTATVSGRALVDGRPAADVAVALLDETTARALDTASAGGSFELELLAGAATTRTDASGVWRFTDVPAGRFRLLVLLEDPRLGPSPRASAPSAWLTVAAPQPLEAPPLELSTRLE